MSFFDENGCSASFDIPYAEAYGWSDDLAKLDIYYRGQASNKPVLVFVHGGGWVKGDKSNIYKNHNFLNFFFDSGFVLASVNFRLLENDKSPKASYRDQVKDIAKSLKWLVSNVDEYGGSADDIVLFGFSSGAHLVSLLSTDTDYLNYENVNPELIKAVIAMDVPAYDIKLATSIMRGSSLEENIDFNEIIFGKSDEEKNSASPISYVNKTEMPFLVISAGIKDGNPQTVSKRVSEVFVSKLRASGRSAAHFHFDRRSHVSLMLGFGNEDDGVTRVVQRFLNRVLGVKQLSNTHQKPNKNRKG